MKAYCIPIILPDPEKEPEQAKAAASFINTLNGLQGVSPHESGMNVLSFPDIHSARVAKWRLEEFCPVSIPIIEGTLSRDKRVLNLNKVIKGE